MVGVGVISVIVVIANICARDRGHDKQRLKYLTMRKGR